MRALRDEIAAAAALPSTVRITGETGVGKGVVARLLHRLSPRRNEPFVHVDCAALSSELVESELYGHERGAFTGAHARRAGRFELAGGGTLFLDEIGDLEARLQAKLLRVLQDRCFERLGGNQTLKMRARIIAASTRDLRREVADGCFRADLYYRLAVISIEVAPLRDRTDDIPALLRAAARRSSELPVFSLTESALARLSKHSWPGNVRELRNVVERCVLFSDTEVFPEKWLQLAASPLATAVEAMSPTGDVLPVPIDGSRSLDEIEKQIIESVLERTSYNATAAAKILGTTRQTLRYRIQKHRIGNASEKD